LVCFPLWYRLRTCGEIRGVHVYTVHCTHVCLGPFIFSILVYPAESFICKLGLSYSSVSKKLKIPKKNKKVKTKKISGWRERYVYFINILQEILFNNLRQCSYSNIIWKRQKKIKRKKNDKIKYKLKVLCFCHVIIIWWIWR